MRRREVLVSPQLGLGDPKRSPLSALRGAGVGFLASRLARPHVRRLKRSDRFGFLSLEFGRALASTQIRKELMPHST